MCRLLSLTLLGVLLACTTRCASGEDNASPALERMSRLSTALKSFRYPEGGHDKITVWRQSTKLTGSFSTPLPEDSGWWRTMVTVLGCGLAASLEQQSELA